jgi:hypothetical protein
MDALSEIENDEGMRSLRRGVSMAGSVSSNRGIFFLFILQKLFRRNSHFPIKIEHSSITPIRTGMTVLMRKPSE